MKEKNNLIVLFIDSLSPDWIEYMPKLKKVKQEHFSSKINTFPGYSAAFLPSFFTGVYPKDHGYFCFVRRIDNPFSLSFGCWSNIFYIPANMFYKKIMGRKIIKIDLLGQPYTKHLVDVFFNSNTSVDSVNQFPTIFKFIDGEYEKTGNIEKFEEELNKISLASEGVFNFQYFTGLDGFVHHNKLYSKEFKDYLAYLDSIINKFISKNKKKARILILSDHGQCELHTKIDIRAMFSEFSYLNSSDLLLFVDSTMFRVWVKGKKLRHKIIRDFEKNEGILYLSDELQKKYSIFFMDRRYGDLIFIAKPGYYFQNDLIKTVDMLYHKIKARDLSSLFKKLKFYNFHGYLPEENCSKGFYLDTGKKPDEKIEEVDIIDVAPTIMEIMGKRKHPMMKGDSYA